jgi:large subunit ribosomal protein L28e
VSFSRDPKNLTNIHSYKYSGLAQSKAIGVVQTTKLVTKKGETKPVAKPQIALVFSTKTVNKPAKATQQNNLSRSPKAADKSISTLVASSYYRPDLRSAALRRYTALAKGARAVRTVKVGRSKTEIKLE